MDKGRDLVAKKIINPLPNITEESKWIVQCKRYTTKSPSKSEINEWLISCKEHNPESVLLVITNTLSANAKDWLQSVRTQFPFKIYIWEEQDIRRQIIENHKRIKENFPEIPFSGETILMYKINNNEYFFGCDEYEEVTLCAYNCRDDQEALIKVREFIEKMYLYSSPTTYFFFE